MTDKPNRPALAGAILVAGVVASALIVLLARSPEPRARATARPSTATRAQAEHAVRTALERHRAMLVQRCWTPALRDGADHIRVFYNVSFDGTGALRIAGVTQESDDLEEVVACLRAQQLTMTIPPTGAPESFEIPFGFPDARADDQRPRAQPFR